MSDEEPETERGNIDFGVGRKGKESYRKMKSSGMGDEEGELDEGLNIKME